MALMIGAMLLRNCVPQHTLTFGVAIAVFVILATYTMFVARQLRREGASRNAIVRAIVGGFFAHRLVAVILSVWSNTEVSIGPRLNRDSTET